MPLALDCDRAAAVTESALTRYRKFADSASDSRRDILLVLSLVGPRNITQLSELVRSAGVHDSTLRAYSTVTLRPILDALISRGLATQQDSVFECARFIRELSLRDAAARGVLDKVANTIRSSAHPYLRFSNHGLEAAWFDFRVALGRGDLHNATTHLGNCANHDWERFVLENPLVQAVCEPFDPVWLQRFRPHDGALVAWALDHATRFGLPTYDLYPWLCKHTSALSADVPMLRVLLAESALLRGDESIVEAQLQSPELSQGPLASSIAASLALLRGEDALALEGFEKAAGLLQGQSGKKKAVGSLPRMFALFHGLALLRRGTADDFAMVARQAAACQRDRSYEFHASATMLKSLAETAMAPIKAETARHMLQPVKAADSMSLLLRGLYAAWFPVADIERDFLLPHMIHASRIAAANQYTWLAEQYLWVAHRLSESLISSMQAKPEEWLGFKPFAVPPCPQKREHARPLVELFDSKPGWQLALQALELLAGMRRESDATDSAQERIVWRVTPENSLIEAALQKRTATGWSSGRRIALKQLLPDGAQHALLSARDRQVAAHVREDISTGWGGYVDRSYHIDPIALLDLAGHPLVFVEPELDRPAELVRGEVRLRAETTGDRLLIRMDPPDITDRPRLVKEAQRWVVYCLDKHQREIAKVVGNALAIPENGKQQTLEVLGRLAQWFTVQSSEQLNAQMVPADPTPWLRLVPNGTGLSVTATVRPLGEAGPVLPTAHGTKTLVSQVHGTPLQTERDLTVEQARLDEVLRDCPVLQLSQIEPGSFALGEPEQCLELVSQLRRVGDGVHVEWPYGKTFALRSSIGRKSLRGSLKHEGGWFVASGTVTVDSELSLELQQLVELLANGSDRFLKLESGEYVEIEQELRELVEALRIAEQRRDKKKQLAIPMSALASLEQLTSEQSGLKLDATAADWRQRFDAAFSKPLPIPRGLQAELRDYQVEGYRWLARLAELDLGACLADDMGLGKTVEIIALLLRRGSAGPVLVVAPTSVCDNWRREVERFAPSLEVRDYLGTNRAQALKKLGKRQIVVTSYTILQQDGETLQAIDWATIVLDEAQFIKNAETLRAKAAYALRAPMRIVATGTPIENHPSDLWSLFHFLNPHLLGSYQRFQKRFGRAAESNDETGTRQKKELRRVIKPFILRRTKAQVLEDLPPLTEIRHTVNLSPAETHLYEVLRKRALAKLAKTDKTQQNRVQVLAELMRLRRLCCHPVLVAPEANLESSKLNAFMELVEELLANQHRALVFSQFVDFLALARKMLDDRGIKYQYLDGSTPQKQRAINVDAFQNGDGDLFLISLKAGGFGLNLTGADYVIHLDPWWNPATEQQASDRAHRIGQERPVTVYRLVTAGTIEERIVALHHRKRELANSLLEGAEGAAKISEKELMDLLAE
jgi:superfamily II DNA or RNA helicase